MVWVVGFAAEYAAGGEREGQQRTDVVNVAINLRG